MIPSASGRPPRVQLAKSAIHQDQSGRRHAFLLQTRIATCHDFYTGEIVIADHGTNDELTTVRILRVTFFPDHHAGDFIGALHVPNRRTDYVRAGSPVLRDHSRETPSTYPS